MQPQTLTGLAISLFLTAGLVAQNVTVPSNMDGVEGGGGTSIPFGGSQACRYQCVYDGEELPWSGPRVLTGVRIRPDFNNGNATPAKGFLEISVLMSTTSRTSATSSNVFEDNYGSDATWVIENLVIQLPAQPQLPATPIAPRPANIDLVFDAPWIFGLTPVINGLPEPKNLLIEIWIHSQPSGAYRVDNMSSCTAPWVEFGNAGPACSIPGQSPVALDSGQSMQAGSSYSWTLSNAPQSMPFALWLNLEIESNLPNLPQFPLPYPLFDLNNPSLPSPAMAIAGFAYSAPDCWINLNSAVTLGGVIDATGEGQVSINLPAGREFVGVTIHAQALVLAPTANALFMITSKGRSATICGPLGVARIFQFYNNSGTPLPPPPAAGSRSLGVGLVLEVF
tara:strand:- start:107302 stop:108486 length:1185 start_codon:yes stop_codon:yes gene_type:complete